MDITGLTESQMKYIYNNFGNRITDHLLPPEFTCIATITLRCTLHSNGSYKRITLYYGGGSTTDMVGFSFSGTKTITMSATGSRAGTPSITIEAVDGGASTVTVQSASYAYKCHFSYTPYSSGEIIYSSLAGLLAKIIAGSTVSTYTDTGIGSTIVYPTHIRSGYTIPGSKGSTIAASAINGFLNGSYSTR